MNLLNDKYRIRLKPYAGIIYFLALLFFFHFSWKLAIDGDMDSEYIYLLDKNITPDWFPVLCEKTAQMAYHLVKLFPDADTFHIDGSKLFYENGGIYIRIIWGCTGIKQLFIFLGIMILYPGPWRQKLWYIPSGVLILSVYNIIRIATTCILTNGHPERFDSLHDGILRYIYYGLIFLIWVVWEEAFAKKRRPSAVK